MDYLKKVFSTLIMPVREDIGRQCKKNLAVSMIVCLSAGIMLIMNIIRHSTFMTITSVILVAGYACRSESKELTAEGLLQRSDKIMYEDKAAFYRQKGHDRRRR